MRITTTNFSIFLITVLTLALIAMTVYSEGNKGKSKKTDDNTVASTRRF